jgi:hypothetical protein
MGVVELRQARVEFIRRHPARPLLKGTCATITDDDRLVLDHVVNDLVEAKLLKWTTSRSLRHWSVRYAVALLEREADAA